MRDSYHVLVVEDQTNIWEDLTEFFEPEIDDGVLTLDFAATAKEGLKKIDTGSNRTDVVIIDVILPDTPTNNELYFINSLDTKVKKLKDKPKGILVSAHKSIDALNDIANQKDWIVEAFVKPLSRKILRQAVEETLDLFSKSKSFANISKDINEDVLREISQEADIIKLKMKRSATDIIEAGKRLYAVKKKLPHGYFKNWIETELGCHYTTGVNLMRVANVFGESQQKVAQMEVAVSILYFLATPSTPKQARQKVIQLIEDGENISFAETKKIVKEYKENNSKVNSEVSGTTNINKSNELEEKEGGQDKQQILQIIRQQSPASKFEPSSEEQQWQKLRNHWLYNGYPDSEEFRQYLPKSIPLTIAFPNDPAWTKDKLVPPQTKSVSIFYSPFEDLDLVALKSMVKNAVELCTEDNEDVVFSFFPEPELLLIVESLGCRCIVAEPDFQRYKRILSV